MSAGLTITTEAPASPDVSIEAAPIARRDLWSRIADPATSDFPDLLGRALRQLVDDDGDLLATLVEENDVTAIEQTIDVPGSNATTTVYKYGRACVEAFKREGAWYDLLELTAALGRSIEGMATIDGETSTTLQDVTDGPLAVIDAAGLEATVAIEIDKTFWEHKANQRRRWLAFVAELAEVLDVQLVASTPIRARLLSDHAEDLPASVVRSASHLGYMYGSACGETEAIADEAHEELTWNAKAWDVLRALSNEPTERLTWHELQTDPRFDVSRSTLSRRLSTLEDLGLIERPTIAGDTHIVLTPAGDAAVEEWVDAYADADAPGQRARETRANDRAAADAELSDADRTADSDTVSGEQSDQQIAGRDGVVQNPPNFSESAVFPLQGREGEDRPDAEAAEAADGAADRDAPTGEWLYRWQHHAIAASTPSSGFALADQDVEAREDRGGDGRGFSYSFDEERGEVVVSVQWARLAGHTGARLAAALLSDQAMSTALTTERLAGNQATGGLDGLSESNPFLLQKGATMGYLNHTATAASYRERLIKERQQLLAQTGDVGRGSEFDGGAASGLASDAHGLLGTALRLYDLLDLDVNINLEFPDYNDDWNTEAAEICKFVTTATTIASRYEIFTAERVLYEPREHKREDSLSFDVDDADPVGECPVSWRLEGPGIGKLADPLEQWLENPRDKELQVDAEKFAPFRIDADVVQAYRRETVAETLARMGGVKRLETTRETTSLLLALLGSTDDVAAAINALGAEEFARRELDLAELRAALSALEPESLLPDAPRSAGKIVHALLEADRAISKAELAQRAGTDADTVGDHRDVLEAIGLLDVDETSAGRADAYRLRLPFVDERHDDDAPKPVYLAGDGTELHDAVYNVAMDVGLGEPLSEDPELIEAMSWPQDLRPLVERWPWLRCWVDVVSALVGLEVGSAHVENWGDGPIEREVTIGADVSPQLQQLTIEGAIEAAGAD